VVVPPSRAAPETWAGPCRPALHQAAAFHFFHHALHLLELLEQSVHLLHLHPGPGGDAALACGFDEFGFAPFCRCHAADDALFAPHLFVGPIHVGATGFGR